MKIVIVVLIAYEGLFMKKQIIGLLSALAIIGFSTGANAAMLTFDEFQLNNRFQTINLLNPNYGSFTWSQSVALIDKDYVHGSGYERGVVSYENALFNGSSDDISISRNTDFVFNGAYFTSALLDANQITVSAYNNNSFVGSKTFDIFNLAPQYISFDFGAVDRLDFSSGVIQRHQFVMDNFIYDEAPPAPEPSSMILGLMSISSLLGLRKKQK